MSDVDKDSSFDVQSFRKQLLKLTKPKLRKRCGAANVDKTGTKNEMINRLIQKKLAKKSPLPKKKKTTKKKKKKKIGLKESTNIINNKLNVVKTFAKQTKFFVAFENEPAIFYEKADGFVIKFKLTFFGSVPPIKQTVKLQGTTQDFNPYQVNKNVNIEWIQLGTFVLREQEISIPFQYTNFIFGNYRMRIISLDNNTKYCISRDSLKIQKQTETVYIEPIYNCFKFKEGINMALCGYLRETQLDVLQDSNILFSICKICMDYISFLWEDCWDDTFCGYGFKLNHNQSEVSYDMIKKQKSINLAYNDDKRVSGWYCVFGKNEINPNDNGLYHWSFKVTHSSGSDNAAEIVIGIVGKTEEEWKANEFKNRLKKGNKVMVDCEKPIHCSYSGKCCILGTPVKYGGYLGNPQGNIGYDSSSEATRKKSSLQFANIGDTFDIFMDCKKGTVQFAVNNVIYDIVWDGLRHDMSMRYRIACSMVDGYNGRAVAITYFSTNYNMK
eukprot:345313_1